MKKILLGTVAVFALTTAGAQAQEYNSNGYDLGPYVGAYGGYGWSYDDVGGSDIGINGGDYGIYAGIEGDALLDATINRVGLGLTGAIEAHYGWSSADDSVGAVEFEKDTEWGVSFKPGLKFLDNKLPLAAAPYAILGYRNTEYDASANIGALTVGGSETYHGFELGFGTELLAYQDVGVRLEYTHVFYGEENGFDPDEDNIRLGLGYHF